MIKFVEVNPKYSLSQIPETLTGSHMLMSAYFQFHHIPDNANSSPLTVALYKLYKSYRLAFICSASTHGILSDILTF